MKKLFYALAASLLCGASASAATVYFENSANWANVYAWSWSDGSEGSLSDALQTTTIDGHTLYEYTTDNGKIIFRGNSGDNWNPQTSDFMVSDGAVFDTTGRIATIVNGAWVALGEKTLAYAIRGSWVSNWKDEALTNTDGIWSGTFEIPANFNFGFKTYYVEDGIATQKDWINNYTCDSQYVSKNENYSIAQPGEYKFALDPATQSFTVELISAAETPAEAWYVGYDMSGSWEFGKVMTYSENDGTYSFTLNTKSGNANTYVSIWKGTEETVWNGWGTTGVYRFGAGSSDVSVDATQTENMTEGSDKCWVLSQSNWGIVVNPATKTITFTKNVATSVSSIEAENAPVMWFNLQGQQVENPSNGIFVKVANGKAVKVVR